MADTGKKEYYEKKPGFVVKSGTVQKISGKTIDYAVYTDHSQGFEFTQDGEHRQVANKTSYDLSGVEGTDRVPAKIIRAVKGDIIIECQDGEIVLRGRNIRLEAIDGSGEVTIVSGKQISLNAPIQNLKGGVSNTVMTNSASTGALATDTTGVMQNSQSSGAEEGEGSILSKLLSLAKKFKSFLE